MQETEQQSMKKKKKAKNKNTPTKAQKLLGSHSNYRMAVRFQLLCKVCPAINIKSNAETQCPDSLKLYA